MRSKRLRELASADQPIPRKSIPVEFEESRLTAKPLYSEDKAIEIINIEESIA